MAPNVSVPTNFGRQHIGSLTHSNLLLNLKDGKTSRANSLILSFNSPVIQDLISNLELTSLDLLEFQETAVSCFIDSLYTGEIELLQKPLFREVTKMAKVFQVVWLLARCEGYFRDLVQDMDGKSYEDMLFFFEEADHVFITMKERGLFELVIQQIGAVNGKNLFISRYMEKYNDISTSKLDRIVELAGADVQIVIESLTFQFTKHLAVHGAILTENTRHLLDNCDLSICRKRKRPVYESLFDSVMKEIDDLSKNDLKWIFELYRTSSQTRSFPTAAAKNVSISTKIPNLFHSFASLKDLDFDNIAARLVEDMEVTNLVMVVEAFVMWMAEKQSVQFAYAGIEVLNKIRILKQEQGWCSVPKECFTHWCPSVSLKSTLANFVNWRIHTPLFMPEDQKQAQIISCQKPNVLTPGKLLFLQENKLMFHFVHPNTSNCTRGGNCGFILKTTPPTRENPDLFNIELCVDHQEYPAKIHLHDDLVRAENMHLMLKYCNYPIRNKDVWLAVSWFGKPHHHDGGFWRWGSFSLGGDIMVKIMYTV